MCTYIKSHCTSLKNHIVEPKYIQFLLVNHTLIKLKKKKKEKILIPRIRVKKVRRVGGWGQSVDNWDLGAQRL